MIRALQNQMLLRIAATFFVVWAVFSLRSIAFAARTYGLHEGYLLTTQGEREIQVRDMIVVQPPLYEGPTLRERIFNDKLSKEFRDRYEEKFGRTEAERVYYSPNRTTYYDDVYGLKGTPQDINDEKRRFGDFMLRRLVEHHVDAYLKEEPKMRPVLEVKERISNVRVEVAQFRLDIAYSIAGNSMDLKLVNPWLPTTRLRLQMDPGRFGPGPVEESIFSLGRGITKTISLEGHYYITDGIVSIVGRKSLTDNLGTSLTASTFTNDTGKSRRESVYLAGLAYSF